MTIARSRRTRRTGSVDRDRGAARPPADARDPPSRPRRSHPPVRGVGSAWRASRTPEGPVTLFLEARAGAVRARAWGPAAGWALARLGGLVGPDDDPARLVPLHRGRGSARPAAAGDADRPDGRRARVARAGDPRAEGDRRRRRAGPGWAWSGATARTHPGPPGMRLPPAPETLAALPYYAFHPFGVEQRRADLIRAVAARRRRLEGLVERGVGTRRRSGAGLRRAPRRSRGSVRGRRPRSGSARSATRMR